MRRASLLLTLAALAAPACAERHPVDGARALARVRHQVEAGPRIPGTPGHAKILAWIEGELTRMGARVERQAWMDSIPGARFELTNVVARFGPATGRPVALCAHWDSRPWSDQDPDTAQRRVPLPGANDGASGVAVLLEVAELLRATPPPVPVELVFLDGEDQGRAAVSAEFCLGARHYAALLARRAEDGRPVAAFVFDMVGDRDLQIHPEVQSQRRASNLVGLVLEGARAVRATHFHDDSRWELTDDHVPILDAGVPAVDIIDFDYPVWHTHMDTPDQVSAESLAEVSRVAAWIVYRSPLARLR